MSIDKPLVDKGILEKNKAEFGTAVRSKRKEAATPPTEKASKSATVLPLAEERRDKDTSDDSLPILETVSDSPAEAFPVNEMPGQTALITSTPRENSEVSDVPSVGETSSDSLVEALTSSDESEQSVGSLKPISTEKEPAQESFRLVEEIKKVDSTEIQKMDKPLLVSYYRALKEVSAYLRGFQRDSKTLEAKKLQPILREITDILKARVDIKQEDLQPSDFASVLLDRMRKSQMMGETLKTELLASKSSSADFTKKLESLDKHILKMRSELDTYDRLKKKNSISLSVHDEKIRGFQGNLASLESFIDLVEQPESAAA